LFKKTTFKIKRQLILYSLIIFAGIVLTYIGNTSHIFAILDNVRFNNNPNLQTSTPFLLPFNKFLPIQNNEGDKDTSTQIIRNHGGIQDPKTQMENPSSTAGVTRSLAPNLATCSTGNLDDTFGSTYRLTDGQISPNGKWQNVYAGFGSTGVENVGGSKVFFLKPKISTSPKDTQAALVKSTGTFCNYTIDFDINTVKQLRQNSPPNTWEAGWFIFRYTDNFHYYWFLIRSDGIELGKKDCDTCTDTFVGQQFLVTKAIPTLKVNTWHHWKLNVDGNHIQIFVDGNLVIDYIDKGMTSQLSSGAVAMYSEDAYVRYDNMHLRPK
jgi:hypothetical protein